jgi:hypothetical protein
MDGIYALSMLGCSTCFASHRTALPQARTSTYGFLLGGILLGATFFMQIPEVLYTLLANIVHSLTAGSWCHGVLGFLLVLGR